MVATYTKPTKIPRWADTSTNILEPPELKKDEGWLFEEVPPSAFENWRTNLIGSWAKWLDERLFDGASADEFLIKSPGAGTEAVRITDAYVKVSRDLRVEGDDLGIEVDGTTSRRVYFDAAKQNWLGYSIGGSRMELYAGGVLAIYADATGTYINGDLNIGDDLSLPGGLAVGIPTPTIADDVIQLGDTDNRWDFNSGSPRFIFDHAAGSVDALTFDRVNSRFAWLIAATEEMRLSSLGLAIANGLYVGDVTGTPTDNVIVAEGSGGFGGSLRVGFAGASILSGVLEIGDTQFYLRQQSGNPSITFDSNDGFNYDRAANKLSLNVNVASRVWMGESGVCILQGLYVGGAGWPVTDDTITCEGNGVFWGGMRIGFSGTPTADRIELGDANLFIQWAADVCEIDFAAGCSFSYSRSSSRYAWLIGTFEKLRLTASGLAVGNGLYVGDVTGTITDNEVYAEGNVKAMGGSVYLGADDYMNWDGTYWRFYLNNTEEVRFSANGVAVGNGLYVGNLAGTIVDKEIRADGDIHGKDLYANGGAGLGRIYMGNTTNNYFYWDGSYWETYIGGVTRERIQGDEWTYYPDGGATEVRMRFSQGAFASQKPGLEIRKDARGQLMNFDGTYYDTFAFHAKFIGGDGFADTGSGNSGSAVIGFFMNHLYVAPNNAMMMLGWDDSLGNFVAATDYYSGLTLSATDRMDFCCDVDHATPEGNYSWYAGSWETTGQSIMSLSSSGGALRSDLLVGHMIGSDGNGCLSLVGRGTYVPGSYFGNAKLFAKWDGATKAEMWVMDGGGTATQISPHDDEGNWIFHSRNSKTGLTRKINMDRVVELVERLTGEQLVFITEE